VARSRAERSALGRGRVLAVIGACPARPPSCAHRRCWRPGVRRSPARVARGDSRVPPDVERCV